ncbi:MAG: hypothetical protein RL701_5508 [Pseudomonadota bacterium]|jgi:iron uptake system component EfeO
MDFVRRNAVYLSLALCALSACKNEDDDDADGNDKGEPAAQSGSFEAKATKAVQTYVGAELIKLNAAAIALQKAAPEPDDNGWNDSDDAAAVKAMQKAWSDARDAYERVEGSIAVLYGDLDKSTDARYNDFISEDGPDDNLFDGEGVTGVHAIERILWSKWTPERVIDFEKKELGEDYVAAAFPQTREEAKQFKEELCERLVVDTKTMRDGIAGTTLNTTAAFWGMIGSMEEQSEKTTLAARGEDESRYAQRTLADMRANLEGAKAVFAAFRPWIEATSKKAPDIQDGLNAIGDAYTRVKGDALPEVPALFDPDQPSDEDLQTQYGMLWQLLGAETNPERATDGKNSVVYTMGEAAKAMDIPVIDEE